MPSLRRAHSCFAVAMRLCVQQLSVLSKKLRTRMHQSWQERSWTMMSGLTKPQATHNNSFNATPLQHFFHPCLLWPKHSAKNLAQPLGKRPAPKVSRHGLARPPTDYAKRVARQPGSVRLCRVKSSPVLGRSWSRGSRMCRRRREVS